MKVRLAKRHLPHPLERIAKLTARSPKLSSFDDTVHKRVAVIRKNPKETLSELMGVILPDIEFMPDESVREAFQRCIDLAFDFLIIGQNVRYANERQALIKLSQQIDGRYLRSFVLEVTLKGWNLGKLQGFGYGMRVGDAFVHLGGNAG